MSSLVGKVQQIALHWLNAPRGATGSANVTVDVKKDQKRQVPVTWRKDEFGIWIELPHGTFGFDIESYEDGDGHRRFRVRSRQTDQYWEELHFARDGEDEVDAGSAGKKKGIRVRAQMPGKIVRVLVKEGEEVQKDQPLLVMEAMKMENELRASHPGRITSVKVTESQTVETGADLVMIEG